MKRALSGLVCACAAVFLLAGIVRAEPLMGDCHGATRFTIQVFEKPEETGELVAVSSGTSCPASLSDADFVVGEQGEAVWFETLAEPYLVLTRSTGPQGDLVVIDLDDRATVLDVPADDFDVLQDGIVFWQRGEVAGPENCPDYAENEANGLVSVTVTQVRFDFVDRKLAPTGQTGCAATQ
jgi:hypothetical protein